jgi:hypothetical protein
MGQISLTKTGMVYVIVVPILLREQEILMVVEWEISIVMDADREIAAEVEMGISTGMVRLININPMHQGMATQALRYLLVPQTL